MDTGHRPHRRPSRLRHGISLVEVAIIVALLALVAVWTLPRLTSQDTVVDDRTAQTNIDLAFDAQLAVLREQGHFTDDHSLLDRYMVAVDLEAATTTDLASHAVSLWVEDPGAARTTVAAAARGSDGSCWLGRRAFGTHGWEVAYALTTGGTCNAERAKALEPDLHADRGSTWSRPLIDP